MTRYICITDQGGSNPTCPDMEYHRPQQHLIRVNEHLTTQDVLDIVRMMFKTRKGVRLVRSWDESEIVDYNIGNVRAA
jgi:hypothetical protein